jgi:hypothetical protein
MYSLTTKISFLALLACMVAGTAFGQLEQPIFHSSDTLAARDDWGLLHQNPVVYPTDFAPRYHWRPLYYLERSRDLAAQPSYMGAVQTCLRRLGYYCGPIDGIFSPEVSDAIAHMQKNYSMRVTGTLTLPVRRALYLP